MLKPDVQNDRYISSALVRGFEILRLFDHDKPKLTLVEIARELGVNRTVPYRLVYTMEKMGYLKQDKVTKQYSLTPKVMELGFSYLKSLQLPEIAQPYLDHLRDLTGFSVHLGILDGSEVVYIARAGARDSKPVLNVKIGSHLPAHATAIGKVLLAYQNDAVVKELFLGSELQSYTKHTKTSILKLQQELKMIQQTGYALSSEEFELGMNSIAVPIVKQSGEVVAAVNVAASLVAISKEALVKEVLPELQKIASEISTYYGNIN